MSPSDQDISVKVIGLLVLKLDFCLNTFGLDNGTTSFCTAIGTPCYKTFENCKDRANFQKGDREYKYSTRAVDIPGLDGVRPYLLSARRTPTEILRDETKSARMFFAMKPDTDKDVGLDPHFEQRATHEVVDYWPVFLQRNQFFEGRESTYYEGLEGQAFSEYKLKFSGPLDDYKVDALGSPTWEAVDQLQGIGDDGSEVPIKLEAELAASITDSDVTLTLTNFDNVQTPTGGETLYVQVNDELVGYTGTTPAQNALTGLARGSFGTTAAAHDEEDAVKNVRYYAPDKPYTIMKDELLIADGGVDPAFIKTDDFTKYTDDPFEDINYSALVLEGDSAKVRDLYFELVGLTWSRSWQDENGMIRIRRRVMNEPGQGYRKIRRQGNIVKDSLKQMNKTKARYTRTRIFWNKEILGDKDEVKEYSRVTIGVDTDIEGPNGVNKQKPFDILDRWHWRGMETDENLRDYLRDAAARFTWLQKYPPKVIGLRLHYKDNAIETGEMIKLYTPRLRNSDGSAFDGEKFQVIKREERADGIHVLLEEQPRYNVGYIAPDGTPDYDLAAEADKEYGFIWDDDLQIPVQGREYYIL